jgi:hypothetical protein
MNMKQNLRKLALTTHITLSVSWLGAAVGFLALAVATLTTHDTQFARGFYLAMGVTGRYAIAPFCLASLLTGLVMSLGTEWGLFRRYWVMTKFLLTMISTFVLLGFMRTLGYISALAADPRMSIDELHKLSWSPALHSGGGLLVLLAATLLSIYKPWGMTPYGLRKRREKREVLLTDLPSGSEPDKEVILDSNSRASLWMLVVGGIVLVMMLLFLLAHLAGGGMRNHH